MKEMKTEKVTIRKSTFETNSSSSHNFILQPIVSDDSFSQVEAEELLKALDPSDKYFINEKEFYLNIYALAKTAKMCGDEDIYFDCEFEILDTFGRKAQYFIATFQYETKYIKAVIEALSRKIPNCIGIFLPVEDSYKNFITYEYNDCEKINNEKFFPIYWYHYGTTFGEINHQSIGKLEGLVKELESELEDGETLADLFYRLIFSEKFVIITDSDCSSLFSNAIGGALIDDFPNTKVLVDLYNRAENEWRYKLVPASEFFVSDDDEEVRATAFYNKLNKK